MIKPPIDLMKRLIDHPCTVRGRYDGEEFENDKGIIIGWDGQRIGIQFMRPLGHGHDCSSVDSFGAFGHRGPSPYCYWVPASMVTTFNFEQKKVEVE